ncbi:MAG: ChaN family lipoprotein [Chthonomonas sp.]|nr:ChaN family lipoprotein [Chthonomonas sp.]
MFALASLLLLQAAPDTFNLPVGAAGSVDLQPGITETRSGRQVDMAALAAAAKPYQFVFVGESHDKLSDHQNQARIIKALVDAGRDVVVGFEMFTRPNQASLAPLTLQRWTLEEFAERSSWKTDWNMDFNLYRPIFEVVREKKLPMVALNIPRDWVRVVGRGGVKAMTNDMLAQMPPLDVSQADHRTVFDSMMGGHSGSMDNTYAAMVMWDTAMADSALKAMRWRSKNAVMVIVAGFGHNAYNQGIGLRLRQQSDQRAQTLNVIPVGTTARVSRGLADFVIRDAP